MTAYKKSAVAIFVNSKKQILLHLRDDKPEILCPGYWAFVGGGVEDGETELEGIRREVKEEIGLLIDNFQYLDKFYVRRHRITVSVYISKLNVPEEKIKISEGQSVKFFYSYEIKNLKMSKVLKNVVSKNLEKILSVASS